MNTPVSIGILLFLMALAVVVFNTDPIPVAPKEISYLCLHGFEFYNIDFLTGIDGGVIRVDENGNLIPCVKN
ncbi:MAG: hypothetical protein DRI46_12290 [Chloroflexi bacterium]|nr:MAG: hypothetical protein DRI46_12290 [Chloroflexota bacterium]